MSASKEKKSRQEQTVSGFSSPKTAREAQQKKEERRSNFLYGAIAVIFVIVAIVTLTWKSGIVQRTATAATIGGEKYSATEVQYYYQTVYQNFVNNYYNYLSAFGLDLSQPLSEQTCGLSQDGGTWRDYFLTQGLQQMAELHAVCDAATADGVVWTDDMQAKLDSSLASLQSSTDSYNANYGTALSVKGYLKSVYGTLMTMKVYQEQVKLAIIYDAYSTAYTDSLSYTTQDLEKAYAEDKNTYDRVAYQLITIDGSAPTKDAEGADVEPTDAEKDAALTAAKEMADSLYASYQGGEKTLSELADANETASYSDLTDSGYTDSVVGNWVFDAARKSGDSAVLADADASRYYIAVFGSRYRYDYNTVDVRHILIKVDETGLDSTAATYEADLQAKKDEAKAKADDILKQWKAGPATEDSFAELANQYSEDPGSNTTGGLYEQVYKNAMVSSFNDWLFAGGRKAGDAEVVYAERTGSGSDYKGYHVIYFVGEDRPYWEILVENAQINSASSAWYAEKTEGAVAEQSSFGIQFVG